ncbi:MAG: 5'-nucleotidase C-terminal domain-containing protein [Gallionella sp.]|nr:5'-nucleotidase C-terminal domain-containing protein [Gallionella sp.]
MNFNNTRIICSALFLVSILLSACGGGDSSTPPAAVTTPTAAVTQPSGTQHALAIINYTLSDPNSDPASILVEYSANGGTTWATATRDPVVLATNEGITALTTSPAGISHTFRWQSMTDGVATAGINNTVRIRITPSDAATGTMATTTDFSVNNNFQQVIGVANALFIRNPTAAGERGVETPLGNLITDAMRLEYGTQLAITNGGSSIRAPLPSSFVATDLTLRRNTAIAGPYDLVMGDVYSILPFGNRVVTRTVTGTQLWAVLERSVGTMPAAFGGFMQISGFSFTYSLSGAVGARVQSVFLQPANTPIAKDGTIYTLATNDFNNAGGDGYVELNDGTGTARRVQADVLLDYIVAQGTLTPATNSRITQVP